MSHSTAALRALDKQYVWHPFTHMKQWLTDDHDPLVISAAEGMHLIDSDGAVCDYELNARLVAMSPAELDAIPFTIGVAAGPNKVAPICAALRGRHVKAMALDEATANGVLRMMGK